MSGAVVNANRRVVTNRAPITFVRCPEHGSKVGRDGEGRLLGRCDGCAVAVADALRWLREHPIRKPVLA